jgi:2-polyprenyl-6-methoxyphenol hydroxylase-like FAD-dependent oxidoreductase
MAIPLLDVLVVGGGPVGLATAIACAQRGLQTTVIERQPSGPDKACGEGLMPAGLLALERFGALKHLDPSRCAPFAGIRYVQEDGTLAEGKFTGGAGRGIRRLALSEALERAASDAGVTRLQGTARGLTQDESRVTVQLEQGPLQARYLAAADGLHSPLRRALGLEGEKPASRRMGLRRHYRGLEPGPWVEVHWGHHAECYLTPCGPDRLGVAFLFDATDEGKPDFDTLLAGFPRVQARLQGAVTDSEIRGAGPLRTRPRAVVQGRVALVGDAAGYVDAITGEGLTLGFSAAEAFAEIVAQGDGLAAYTRAHQRLFTGYARSAGALLWLSRHRRLRQGTVQLLARVPRLFDLALRRVA